jgi:hypothetical protein
MATILHDHKTRPRNHHNHQNPNLEFEQTFFFIYKSGLVLIRFTICNWTLGLISITLTLRLVLSLNNPQNSEMKFL